MCTQVRVLDCEYEPSQAAVDDDDDRPPEQVTLTPTLTLAPTLTPTLRPDDHRPPEQGHTRVPLPECISLPMHLARLSQVLTRVQLTLVDGSNMPVGLPAWCSLLEVLHLLKDEHVLTASCAEEDELRRRRRVALHVQEQRKLAIHHLQLARRRGARATGSATNPLDPKRDGTLGVDDLLRQLAVKPIPLTSRAHSTHEPRPSPSRAAPIPLMRIHRCVSSRWQLRGARRDSTRATARGR